MSAPGLTPEERDKLVARGLIRPPDPASQVKELHTSPTEEKPWKKRKLIERTALKKRGLRLTPADELA